MHEKSCVNVCMMNGIDSTRILKGKDKQQLLRPIHLLLFFSNKRIDPRRSDSFMIILYKRQNNEHDRELYKMFW